LGTHHRRRPADEATLIQAIDTGDWLLWQQYLPNNNSYNVGEATSHSSMTAGLVVVSQAFVPSPEEVNQTNEAEGRHMVWSRTRCKLRNQRDS
jgi:hypothetical protein